MPHCLSWDATYDAASHSSRVPLPRPIEGIARKHLHVRAHRGLVDPALRVDDVRATTASSTPQSKSAGADPLRWTAWISRESNGGWSVPSGPRFRGSLG